MSFDPFSFAGSLLTGMMNNSSVQDRQDSANTFSAQQYASRYQTTVSDMQAAGLNPALAYGGISGSPPSSAIASSAGTPDLGANYTQAKLASAQVANVAADTENKKAQADLIHSQVRQTEASADQANAATQHYGASIDKIREEVKNIPTERGRLIAATEQLVYQASLMDEQGKTQSTIRSELEARIAKLRSESKILGFDIDAAASLGNVGRETQQLKPFFDIVRGLLRK